jgi:pyrroloquinoline quinone biosynthesis protein B
MRGIMAKYLFCILLLCLARRAYAQDGATPYIYVLGVAQDGGYPHMGCMKNCCLMAWQHDSMKKYVVSLALVDPASSKWWLLEATPDIKYQLHYFQMLTGGKYNYLPEGIFITHAHIGHYTGLMQLGREVMNTKNIPVYTLPRMKAFLETNGPWGQLVSLHNIALRPLKADSAVTLAPGISINAFLVPHRDEYSETAGFKITAGGKKYLFIPDINKWALWERSIVEEVQSVDVALLDGTFYDGTELPGRNMSEVPHPFVTETMELFANTGIKTTSKVYFIHLNHTNPLLWDPQKQGEIKNAGFRIAGQGEKL